MYVAPAHAGLIVTDAALTLRAFNNEAVQILTFPERQEQIRDLQGFLRERIRSRLFEGVGCTPVRTLRSGRRTYVCKSFALSVTANSHAPDRGGTVILLERKSNGVVDIDSIAQTFALTERERETVRLLFEGLTSKEIACRMNISPHTVNAFVRLIMVKMGVSNRSGIIGKIARIHN